MMLVGIGEGDIEGELGLQNDKHVMFCKSMGGDDWICVLVDFEVVSFVKNGPSHISFSLTNFGGLFCPARVHGCFFFK